MSSDDLTQELQNGEEKTTQPMIADVFRLVEQGQQALNMRLDGIDAQLNATNTLLDATNTRFDDIELRLARDFEGVNTRIANGFGDLSSKINVLNRSRLQTEADYESLFERVRELESKAS